MDIVAERKWEWLSEKRSLDIPAKHTTGTVAVTNGSRTVTGTGTYWTEVVEGQKIIIGENDNIYEIISMQTASTTYRGTAGGPFVIGDTITGSTSSGTGRVTEVTEVSMNYTSASGTFSTNETITGGTSSATGQLISANGSTLKYKPISGNFETSETITGGTSGATCTSSTVGTATLKYIPLTGTLQNSETITGDLSSATSNTVAVTATQTIQLSADITEDTSASSSYTMFQDSFGLFPDLDQIMDIWHSNWTTPMMALGPRQMNELKNKYWKEENKAAFYTMAGHKPNEGKPLDEFILDYDFLDSDDCYELLLFPSIPDEDYVIHIRYKKRAEPLVNDDDEPLIPEQYRTLLLYGALADYYSVQRNQEMYQLFTSRFEKELHEMESNYDDVKDRPVLKPSGSWRGSRASGLPRSAGDFFDRYYFAWLEDR